MIGGVNKILRNLESKVKGNGQFEARLIKATFNGDTKEPKEKHLLCKSFKNMSFQKTSSTASRATTST